MSASVLFFLKSLRRNLFFDGIFLEDYFIQDEVLCYVVQFINQINKLQPAGSNRVSPACSVLVQFNVILCMYSMCMNDLLFMIIIMVNKLNIQLYDDGHIHYVSW